MSGPSKVTIPPQDRFVRSLTLRNGRILRTAANVIMLDRTILNHLSDANLKSRRTVVSVPLTRRHKELRLD